MSFFHQLCILFIYPNTTRCITKTPDLPPPLAPRRRGTLLTQVVTNSHTTQSSLVARGLQLIICLTGGCRGANIPTRSVVSVNAVKLVGTIGAFAPRQGVGLTACTDHYVNGRVLVCLHGDSGHHRRTDVSRPLGISNSNGRLLLSSVLNDSRSLIDRQLRRDTRQTALQRSITLLSPQRHRVVRLHFKLLSNIRHARGRTTSTLNVDRDCVSHLRGHVVQRLGGGLRS